MRLQASERPTARSTKAARSRRYRGGWRSTTVGRAVGTASVSHRPYRTHLAPPECAFPADSLRWASECNVFTCCYYTTGMRDRTHDLIGATRELQGMHVSYRQRKRGLHWMRPPKDRFPTALSGRPGVYLSQRRWCMLLSAVTPCVGVGKMNHSFQVPTENAKAWVGRFDVRWVQTSSGKTHMLR